MAHKVGFESKPRHWVPSSRQRMLVCKMHATPSWPGGLACDANKSMDVITLILNDAC